MPHTLVMMSWAGLLPSIDSLRSALRADVKAVKGLSISTMESVRVYISGGSYLAVISVYLLSGISGWKWAERRVSAHIEHGTLNELILYWMVGVPGVKLDDFIVVL